MDMDVQRTENVPSPSPKDTHVENHSTGSRIGKTIKSTDDEEKQKKVESRKTEDNDPDDPEDSSRKNTEGDDCRSEEESDGDDDESVTDENEDEVLKKRDDIMKKLALIENKLNKFEMRSTYTPAQRLVVQRMLDNLYETHQGVLADYMKKTVKTRIQHLRIRASTNSSSQSKHPDEYNTMVPIVNKFLREEAKEEGSACIPHTSDIEYILKRHLKCDKIMARELAEEIVENLTKESKRKSMDFKRWAKEGGDVMPIDDPELLRKLQENDKQASARLKNSNLNFLSRGGNKELVLEKETSESNVHKSQAPVPVEAPTPSPSAGETQVMSSVDPAETQVVTSVVSAETQVVSSAVSAETQVMSSAETQVVTSVVSAETQVRPGETETSMVSFGAFEGSPSATPTTPVSFPQDYRKAEDEDESSSASTSSRSSIGDRDVFPVGFNLRSRNKHWLPGNPRCCSPASFSSISGSDDDYDLSS